MTLGWSMCVCAAGLMACVAVPSFSIAQEVAQPEAKADTQSLVKSIIADLGSEDVTLRIDAQQRLTDAATIKLKDLELAAKGAVLTPEQRRRLTSAAYVRFCLEPRGGMGVMSNLEFGERGLLLQAVVPGFPAAEVLRAGDRVLSVNGQSINDINMMRPVVISRDPGDEVPVVVVRGGATLNLKVKLGRATDLNSRDRFAITADMLDQAWVHRVEAFTDPAEKNGPAVIESGIAEADWKYVGTAEVTMDFNDGGDPNLDTRFKIDASRLQNPDRRDVGVVAAGEPRGAGSPFRWATQGGMKPTMRVGPGGNMRLAPDAAADVLRGDIERIRMLELTQIREAQAQARVRIDELTGQLAGADEAKRKGIVELVARLQRRIVDLEARARAAQQLNP